MKYSFCTLRRQKSQMLFFQIKSLPVIDLVIYGSSARISSRQRTNFFLYISGIFTNFLAYHKKIGEFCFLFMRLNMHFICRRIRIVFFQYPFEYACGCTSYCNLVQFSNAGFPQSMSEKMYPRCQYCIENFIELYCLNMYC